MQKHSLFVPNDDDACYEKILILLLTVWVFLVVVYCVVIVFNSWLIRTLDAPKQSRNINVSCRDCRKVIGSSCHVICSPSPQPIAIMGIKENDTELSEMSANIAVCFSYVRQYVFTFSFHITDMLCALCM